MPCNEMMITDVVTVKTGQTVDEAIKVIEDAHIRFAPVVDDAGQLVGVFSTRSLMRSLLPVSVTMVGGLETLDFVMGATPGVAKRLRKSLPKLVGDVMCVPADVTVIHPEKTVWEAIRLMAATGDPLPVVGNKGDFLGLITEQSILENLHRVIDELEAQGEFDNE
jgi:CBS domain-containing protein